MTPVVVSIPGQEYPDHLLRRASAGYNEVRTLLSLGAEEYDSLLIDGQPE